MNPNEFHPYAEIAKDVREILLTPEQIQARVAELGKQIVSSFIDKDERILDKQARLEFLRQGSPMSSLFGQPADMDPRQLSQQIGKSITLTTAKMDALPGLMDKVNQLAFALQKEDQSVVARARTYAQSYTSIFGKSVPPSYIDLGNFAQLLQRESSNSAVRTAAAADLSRPATCARSAACTSCACAGVALRPVPMAHTGSYASAPRARAAGPIASRTAASCAPNSSGRTSIGTSC